jgi:hypothetical protein
MGGLNLEERKCVTAETRQLFGRDHYAKADGIMHTRSAPGKSSSFGDVAD